MSNGSSGSGLCYHHKTSYNGSYINHGSHASNGGIIINHSPLLGLEKLTNAASPNAFYDSAANQLPSTTHTKLNPVADHYTPIAMDWIRSQNSISIMWLAGESRALTSLIAQRTAESLSEQKNLLTTFFFSKGDSGRNGTKHFVPSLAYGIIQSVSVPESQDAITQAVEKDPLVLSASIEKQFDKLIRNPLNHYLYHQRADNQQSTFPHVIIVNALDECEDVPEREQILRLFERLYTARLNGDHLPWKVLVTSRFDQTIEEVLKTFPYSEVSIVFLAGEGGTQAEKSPFRHSPTLIPAPSNPAHPFKLLPRKSSGLRLLSIDGGGIRGLSALIILEEITQGLQVLNNLRVPPKPCELFDLAGGTGTGGLIVILLFRLQMFVSEAMDTYVRVMQSVFSEGRKGWSDRSSRLETALLSLISTRLGISIEKARTERMIDETGPKCFVCATPIQHKGKATLFRTWGQSHRNVTIFEAARATCTLPGLFKSTAIVVGEAVETFVDAGDESNNPTVHVLTDAMTTFASPPSCVVSLGTGLEGILKYCNPDSFQRLLPTCLPTQLIQVFKKVARNCEETSELLKEEMSEAMRSVLYFRLNVGRGMEGVSLEEWEKPLDVERRTKQCLDKRVDKVVNVLRIPTAPSV